MNPLSAAFLAGRRWWFSAGLAIYLGTSVLALPQAVRQAMERGTIAIVLLQAAPWGHLTVRAWIDRYTARYHHSHAGNTAAMPMLVFVLRDILWSTIVPMLLANLDVNIATLARSPGMIVVAVWLAPRDILGALADSGPMALGRPFVIGDFISMRDTMRMVGRPQSGYFRANI